MKNRKIQCRGAALLTAAVFTAAGPAVARTAEPSPAATPLSEVTPSPTPRIIPVALHFRRPAKIIPVRREDGEAEIPLEDFEIADETPWLTGEDIRWFSYWEEEFPDYLQVYLTPEGVEKFSEARMGNFGRKVILVIDGTVRSVAPLEEIHTRRADRLDFYGDFYPAELERLQTQIAIRPPPTPTPAPSPTPARKERFIIR